MEQGQELLECLKANSRERKKGVDWGQKVGISIPFIYYGVTDAINISDIYF